MRRPKLEAFTGIIDAILAADRGVPRKQRHTAQRIFERLRDEHGFTGSRTGTMRRLALLLAILPTVALADISGPARVIDGNCCFRLCQLLI